jgi:hypothetical protein
MAAEQPRVVEVREHVPGSPWKILGPLPFNKEILPLSLHTTRVVAAG